MNKRASGKRRGPSVDRVRPAVRHVVEALESRLLLYAYTWVGESGNWTNPGNWFVQPSPPPPPGEPPPPRLHPCPGPETA